jgi:thiol-disulfide isomerase/thioredoxin
VPLIRAERLALERAVDLREQLGIEGAEVRVGRTHWLASRGGRLQVLRMIPVLEATPETFDELVLNPKDELVVVYFWGPDCPNCEFFASRFSHVLEKLGDVPARIVKVNAYEHDALGTRFAIFGIPQFHLFRDGKRLGKMSEFRGDDFFVGVISEHLPGTCKC